MDHLEFPDGVKALSSLIDGKLFSGHTVTAGKHMPIDAYGKLTTTPFALLIGEGGTPGYIDQVERLRVEVYAEGNDALGIAKAIRTALAGENIDTPAGFLDSIKADQVPTDIPYTDVLSQANLLLSIITRPL